MSRLRAVSLLSLRNACVCLLLLLSPRLQQQQQCWLRHLVRTLSQLAEEEGEGHQDRPRSRPAGRRVPVLHRRWMFTCIGTDERYND